MAQHLVVEVGGHSPWSRFERVAGQFQFIHLTVVVANVQFRIQHAIGHDRFAVGTPVIS